jgi:endonuclease YncB( thermonuclease family)
VLCADLPARADADLGARIETPGSVSLLDVRVIDGGTLENTATHGRYGLENVDAPAIESAVCASERAFGERAAAAAETLLGRARSVVLTPTGRFDASGRAMVFVSIDGRDLGELLISQGAARSAREKAEPWCDGEGDLLL